MFLVLLPSFTILRNVTIFKTACHSSVFTMGGFISKNKTLWLYLLGEFRDDKHH